VCLRIFFFAREARRARTPERAKTPKRAQTPERAKTPKRAKTPERAQTLERAKTPKRAKTPERTQTLERAKTPRGHKGKVTPRRNKLLTSEFKAKVQGGRERNEGRERQRERETAHRNKKRTTKMAARQTLSAYRVECWSGLFLGEHAECKYMHLSIDNSMLARERRAP
jgi:hypothetical protein